jgi:predicted lactoylglutathione lyase
MPKVMFIGLPVHNVAASKRFYEALGFTFNPQFSDDSTASMVWSDVITVMLHTHAKWGTFTSRPIPPTTASEVMLAVSCDERETIDVMSKAAAANGGQADINPVKDLGFMYNRSLADPDGHVWEVVWMNPAGIGSASR